LLVGAIQKALQKKKGDILKKREGRKMCFSWRGNSSFKNLLLAPQKSPLSGSRFIATGLRGF